MFRIRTVCKLLGFCAMLGGGASFSLAQGVDRVASEDDYFANVPVVLTASRLEQPLNEAPGAMTVIDRHTIRLSGARTVADVLRLVPGYFSGGWNGANPVAAYHIPVDDYGTRNLVLIDGRSVYSSAYLGDTHRGMLDVMLEDIERIEVLRGANSAAYGANAMFGVINIITRHSADTIGGEVSLTYGDSGIQDRRARLGFGDERASFRLSVGDQRDSGYLNVFDDLSLSHLHGRADFKPTVRDDLMLTAGVTYQSGGEGFAVDAYNPLHTVYTNDVYLNGQWRHQLSDADELQFSVNYMEDWRKDVAYSTDAFHILMDYGGRGERTNMEVQRKTTLSPTVRTVVGVGYKDEKTRSLPLYATDDWQSFHEERVFGTLEWRFTPEWLLNAGLFVGQHSQAGLYKAPRLMLNWLPTPEHTFRAGVTESMRTPSLSELNADIRYYLGGVLVEQEFAARGLARPEKLRSQEIGYLGRFPNQNLTVDVRLYNERLVGFIGVEKYDNPETGIDDVKDYMNKPGFEIRGVESQMRWKPFEGSEIWWNQSFSTLDWEDPVLNARRERRPPQHASTLAWFQRLPGQFQLSVVYQFLGSMTWRDKRDWLAAAHRTDVRLAYPFRVGGAKAEASLTVQSAEGSRPFFLPRRNLEVGRRTFMNISMEY